MRPTIQSDVPNVDEFAKKKVRAQELLSCLWPGGLPTFWLIRFLTGDGDFGSLVERVSFGGLGWRCSSIA